MAFEIIFMDAGQGDATLIVYPDGSLTLVDCGCKKNKEVVATQISKVLTRYLKNTSNRLKNLVLTHPDGDHYNLVKPLLDTGVVVGNVYFGGQSSDYSGLTSWLNSHTGAVPLSQGYGSVAPVTSLSYDGGGTKPNVEVRILSANAGDPSVKADANPNSIVLGVTYLDLNFFLMGDSTVLTESFIVKNLGGDLDKLLAGKRTVLKAGHHGSNTSSHEEWIKKIVPEVCFISSDTRTFSGVSIPRSGVIKRIFDFGKIHDFGSNFEHKYVQYNDSTDKHEQVSTTKALFTTLHLLSFVTDTLFISYGTSWYYRVDDSGVPGIGPACDWEDINKAF
jgi:beta-lactamase superfamily II metal-dependent hydrolase